MRTSSRLPRVAVLLLALALGLVPRATFAQSGQTVAGTILTAAGKPLAGCDVSLQFAGPPTAAALPPPSFAVTATGLDGSFFFKSVPSGTYVAMPRLVGFAFTPSSQLVTVGTSDVGGVDFTARRLPRVTVSGHVLASRGKGLGNIAVTLSSGPNIFAGAPGSPIPDPLPPVEEITTTAPDGSYAFPDVYAGSYLVQPTDPAWIFTPATTYLMVGAADVAGVDFTAVPAPTYRLSGEVAARDGHGVDNVPVLLTPAYPIYPPPPSPGAPGAIPPPPFPYVLQVATTDRRGRYHFDGVLAGDYNVSPHQAAYAFTPQSRLVHVKSADITGLNFTARGLPTYHVSGQVITATGHGVGGVNLHLQSFDVWPVVGPTAGGSAASPPFPFPWPPLPPSCWTRPPRATGTMCSTACPTASIW